MTVERYGYMLLCTKVVVVIPVLLHLGRLSVATLQVLSRILISIGNHTFWLLQVHTIIIVQLYKCMQLLMSHKYVHTAAYFLCYIQQRWWECYFNNVIHFRIVEVYTMDIFCFWLSLLFTP